jgi:S-layer homology domain
VIDKREKAMRRCRFVGIWFSWFLVACSGQLFAAGVTFTVTNTFDSGTGSLREAIGDSNASPGDNTIHFAIPGTGPFTIQLTSALPAITNPVILDGYSQSGASPNTNPPGQGFNSVLEIQISGTEPPTFGCLDVEAGNGETLAMEVRGLVINHCDPAITVGAGGQNAVISGNFVGTDPTGTLAENPKGRGFLISGVTAVSLAGNLVSGNGNTDSGGFVFSDAIAIGEMTGALLVGNLVGTDRTGTIAVPGGGGIDLANTSAVTIGGDAAEDRNVIVAPFGVYAPFGSDTGLQIVGNFFGTDVTGTKTLGHANTDIQVSSPSLIQGNVIAGAEEGIDIDGNDVVVRGNFIGTDATGTLDLGLTTFGILVTANGGGAQIGGTAPGDANVIAHCGSGSLGSGGVVELANAATIRGNSIFDNEPLGIDLGGDGVTPNLPGGAQNFPVVTSVSADVPSTEIQGSLNAAPSTAYVIDLYIGPSCGRRPQDFLEGQTYLGNTNVETDGAGNATFDAFVPRVLPPGTPVTATATDPGGTTSEFSQGLLFSVSPPSGPTGGASGVALSGMLFVSGDTVAVDGVPATDVAVHSSTSITANMPAFPAATLHDVTVTDPTGLVGTLKHGWLADFLDVPPSNLFHDFVARLVESGIAAGIGGGNYGVSNSTLRQQMAVFLEKAIHGQCYTPPPCSGVFGDVPCPSQFADWIEALAADRITGGCGGGDFCPTGPVRRDQMAVFLLKAEHGPGYRPAACHGLFADVPCPSQFADWIEELSNESITGGCGSGDYCPGNPATRGQMAAFVMKVFPMP